MKKIYFLPQTLIAFLVFINIQGVFAQGNFVWAKQQGGSGYDVGTYIRTDPFGNVYVMGTFGGTADFDPGPGSSTLTVTGSFWDQDVFLCKLDASGNLLWVKQFGTVSYDMSGKFAFDAEGNVYIVGAFSGTMDFDPGPGIFNLSTTGYNQDPFVCKLDASGNFVWAKQFYGSSSSHYAQGEGIALDATGNVLVTGTFQGLVDFDPGAGTDTISSYDGEYGSSADIFIAQLSNEGNLNWVKRIGGTDYEDAAGISVDNSGNIFTAGSFGGPVDFDPGPGTFMYTTSATPWGGFNANIYVNKLDHSGNFKWAKMFKADNYEGANAITVDQAGNVYTAGGYEGEMDFNPGDGAYILAPASGSTYDQDIFVVKLDSAGNLGWARSMGGSGYDNGNDVAVDVAGNVYTIGNFQDSADFNPRPGTYMLKTVGMYASNIFISKLNDAGTFAWAKNIGGTADYLYNQGYSVTVDAETNIFATGAFSGTVDADPGAGDMELSATGGPYDNDIFIEKLHDTLSTVNIEEQFKNSVNEFKLYPNPNSGAFKIAMNLEADSKLTVDIVDITGQVIRTISSSKLSAGFNSIDVDESGLSSGIYFVRIYNDDINRMLKLSVNK